MRGCLVGGNKIVCVSVAKFGPIFSADSREEKTRLLGFFSLSACSPTSIQKDKWTRLQTMKKVAGWITSKRMFIPSRLH